MRGRPGTSDRPPEADGRSNHERRHTGHGNGVFGVIALGLGLLGWLGFRPPKAATDGEERELALRREPSRPQTAPPPIDAVHGREIDVPAKPAAAPLKRLARDFLGRFNRDEISTRAAALAFVGILSLVPLLLVALAALGFVIRNPAQAQQYMTKLVASLLPGRAMTADVQNLMTQTHIAESAQGLMRAKWWAMVAGLLSLIWTATSLFTSAAAPMNRAWDVKETRGWLRLRLVCLGVFLAAGSLFLLSLLPSAGPAAVRGLHLAWLGLPARVPFWIDAAFLLVSILLDVSMFVVIYRFLPNAPVTWRAAAIGGGVAGLLWELFKKGFAIYLAHFGHYNKLYGALGGLVGLVTWIYYSCLLLLAGAILCKMAADGLEGSDRYLPPKRGAT